MIPNYIWQHIIGIISDYRGDIPLSAFLKKYFKSCPNAGSRDRKLITDMAFAWYRCSKGLPQQIKDTLQPEFKNQMLQCMQLTRNNFSGKYTGLICDNALDTEVDLMALLPYDIELSDDINKQDWLSTMLVQPNTFIRIRNQKDKIEKTLTDNLIPYNYINADCISVPSATKIDTLLPAESYVIQDASSQFAASNFKPKKTEKWYDCCSGAGGKSLYLKDIEPNIDLTISDKRPNIIHNLLERFELYKHQKPTVQTLDLTDLVKTTKVFGATKFDNIICDAPCSGSGTWARTPEQLYFFKESQLQFYTELQKAIATNVSEFLKVGGFFYYITCSIFKQENEIIVANISKITGMELIESKLINGTKIKADSMFIAIFRK